MWRPAFSPSHWHISPCIALRPCKPPSALHFIHSHTRGKHFSGMELCPQLAANVRRNHFQLFTHAETQDPHMRLFIRLKCNNLYKAYGIMSDSRSFQHLASDRRLSTTAKSFLKEWLALKIREASVRLFPDFFLSVQVKMLNILRGNGGKDLTGYILKFSLPAGHLHPYKSERRGEWPWMTHRRPSPHLVVIGKSLWFTLLTERRGIFHWPVGHFSRQVSSLSACWQCFENRDKVLIVLKRPLKENFWKVSPNILFLWLMGSVQGFFQMTDGLHQRPPLFILTLTEEKKTSQSQTGPLMQCDFVLVLWKEEKCCEKQAQHLESLTLNSDSCRLWELRVGIWFHIFVIHFPTSPMA